MKINEMALDIREWSGKVKHAELPMDQPPAVAFTAFADVWPRAAETEIGTALCAIGAGRTLTFFDASIIILPSKISKPNLVFFSCQCNLSVNNFNDRSSRGCTRSYNVLSINPIQLMSAHILHGGVRYRAILT